LSDSSPPPGSPPPSTPPPAPRVPPKRPLYLVIALLMVWLVGLFGSQQGCQTIELLHQPDRVRANINRSDDREQAKQGETLMNASLQFRHILTPLAVGQLLLASLLTLTAGLTLLGRVQARQLALQAMAAYALFLPIDYVARSPMRAVIVDVVAHSVTMPSVNGVLPPPELTDPAVRHDIATWGLRVLFGTQLAIVGLGILALTRPRARAFFGAAADRTRDQ
jgi:hypothetical protein